MANYLIQGTVTDWPEGTVDIDAAVTSESGSDDYQSVDMNNGQYTLLIDAEAGEKVWIEFFAGNLSPPPDHAYTAIKAFGPFIIDDIGVLQ